MDLLNAWKNRRKILEGIWNSIFPNSFVKKIAAERRKICESNTCGYYDSKGINNACYIKGSPCCIACGCNMKWKHHSLSSQCGLSSVEKEPLWKSIMSSEQEEKFKAKHKIKDSY